MDKAGRRIEVLLRWRDDMEAAGHEVPPVPDMMRIGASGEVRPEGIVEPAAVRRWEATLGYLLKQLRFGVNDPVSHLPEDLMAPAPAPAPPPAPAAEPSPPSGSPPAGGPTTPDDPVFAALRSWWRAEQGRDPALRALKEHHLRNIAMTGSRTETEIRRHLPAALAGLARRLAEVVALARPAPVVEPVTVSTPRTSTSKQSPPPPPNGAKRAPEPPPAHGPPRPDGPGDQPADGVDPELAALELADYAYTPPEREPVRIRQRVVPHGRTLSWPPADVGAETVLYRVVSADDRWAPHTPQAGDPLVVTERSHCLDPRPFPGPVRQVQVWVHAGRTRAQAAAAEPVLHAQSVLVAQVSGARVREDGASIVGQWSVPPGVESVEVLRVPREHARRDGHSGTEYRLNPLRPFVNGFVDDGAERGRAYVYELSVEVDVEGTRLRSDPVKIPISVSAVLAPVTDLRRVDRPDDQGVFDLHWTQPVGGEVRIYRTRQEPTAGIAERPVPVSVLAQARLDEDAVVGRPIEPDPDGGWSMYGVAWPDGWTFAYLTPVTVLDGMAAVGPSLSAVRLAPVREAKIVERTHRQVLTFAWPAGADAVLAYVGGPGQDARGAQRGEPEEIGHERYVNQGGMHFRNRLARKGCSVHLVPVAYNRGEQIEGPPVSLDYPGLLQLGYRVRAERDRAQRTVGLVVQIFAEIDHPSAPSFTLVYRPDRLPLHERDGTVLPMSPFGDPRATGGPQFRPSVLWANPGEAVWTARVDDPVGFVRLFLSLPPHLAPAVALFDPPVDDLRLGPSR